MPLCTPTLVGPISEWSSTLLVEGCVPGATVTVRSLGPSIRTVAKTAGVGGGRDRIHLLPAEKLRADDLLVLSQESAAGPSLETDKRLAFPVAPAPTNAASLPPLAFVSHIYECGQAVWVGGAVPGASVTVQGVAAAMIAQGSATEDRARLAVTGLMPSAEGSISASQAAPVGWPPLSGAPQTTKATVNHIPTPSSKPLKTPVFAGDQPPEGCDASVRIGGIIDGAMVKIVHSGGAPSEQAAFDLSTLTFLLAKPLPKQGETLHITQAVRIQCERKPSVPLDIDVAPAQKPASPGVLSLCPGVVQVPVSNLVSGATVTISINGAPYSGMAPADKTTMVFEVAPIPPAATVDVVQQNRCGMLSGKTIVPVAAFGAASKAQLAEPLLECARVVRVQNAQPGAYLQVWAQTGGTALRPISPRVLAWQNSLRIAVTPYLAKGDSVWVEQLACSGNWVASKHLPVNPAAVKPVGIPFPIEGDDYVIVQALPGAHVDIFSEPKGTATPEFLGDGDVDSVLQRIQLLRSLNLSDRLFGIQTLCSDSSHRSESLVPVLPSARTFQLSAPILRESTTNAHLPLSWDQGILTCRHNGGWTLTAHIQNQETDADVDFVFQVKLIFVDAVGRQFVSTREALLSASGNGEVTQMGLRIQGYPPEDTYHLQGTFDPFREPEYWAQILKTTAAFDLPADQAIWNTYANADDKPEGWQGED